MRALLRLYPRAWRERYGGELDALLEDLPAGAGTSLDLLVGALAANAAVIRANRILSAAAAGLHGVGVAFLLQAIAFVCLVLASQVSQGQINISAGPIKLASVVVANGLFLLGQASEVSLARLPEVAPALVLLVVLAATLVVTAAGPRFVRRRAS